MVFPFSHPQLSMFQQKLTKLEQEKEHYILELQLLKIKFENEQTVSSIPGLNMTLPEISTLGIYG